MPHISNSRSPYTARPCPNKTLLTTRIAPLAYSAYSCFVKQFMSGEDVDRHSTCNRGVGQMPKEDRERPYRLNSS